MTGVIILSLTVAVWVSVAHDQFTYTARQDAWEKAHPGKTYIRHYRRKNIMGVGK
jgi:hypothetical protein